MSLIGYARVSDDDQDLEVQRDLLRDAGCDHVFEEKCDSMKGSRPEWDRCLEFLREGDILVFTRLDRIGRSVLNLAHVREVLETRGVGIRALQQPGLDTSNEIGRAMWGMLAVFAELEKSQIRTRQLAGIRRAKAQGKYAGRKRKVTKEAVAELKADGLGATAIAKKLKCDRTAVYRAHPDGWGAAPIGG